MSIARARSSFELDSWSKLWVLFDDERLEFAVGERVQLFIKSRASLQNVQKLLDSQLVISVGGVEYRDSTVVNLVADVLLLVLLAGRLGFVLVLLNAITEESFSLADVLDIALVSLEVVNHE